MDRFGNLITNIPIARVDPKGNPADWVFDVAQGRLLFQEMVAHGRNTGERLAERFSNVEGSKMSSLGLFQTAETGTPAEYATISETMSPALLEAVSSWILERFPALH